MFGGLFGKRREIELAKVLNLYFGTFHRVYSKSGLMRVLGTIERLENLEVSIDDDQLMGFYIRTEDLKGFYFRLIKKGGNGPAIVASGSGPYFGFSVSANLATGKLEVWCKPSQGTVPSEQAYALTKVLKRKFGAVET
jgi:hypothetical protein